MQILYVHKNVQVVAWYCVFTEFFNYIEVHIQCINTVATVTVSLHNFHNYIYVHIYIQQRAFNHI